VTRFPLPDRASFARFDDHLPRRGTNSGAASFSRVTERWE